MTKGCNMPPIYGINASLIKNNFYPPDRDPATQGGADPAGMGPRSHRPSDNGCKLGLWYWMFDAVGRNRANVRLQGLRSGSDGGSVLWNHGRFQLLHQGPQMDTRWCRLGSRSGPVLCRHQSRMFRSGLRRKGVGFEQYFEEHAKGKTILRVGKWSNVRTYVLHLVYRRMNRNRFWCRAIRNGTTWPR